MTTIAWDGKTLAADSQATAGNVVTSTTTLKIITPGLDEIWRIRGKKILAFSACGDACANEEFTEALQKGIFTETKMRSGLAFSAIAVTGIGSGFEIFKKEGGEEIAIYLLDSPRAFGSGSEYALSAMHLGMTAQDAVNHASQIDLYSGGAVNIYEVDA